MEAPEEGTCGIFKEASQPPAGARKLHSTAPGTQGSAVCVYRERHQPPVAAGVLSVTLGGDTTQGAGHGHLALGTLSRGPGSWPTQTVKCYPSPVWMEIIVQHKMTDPA